MFHPTEIKICLFFETNTNNYQYHFKTKIQSQRLTEKSMSIRTYELKKKDIGKVKKDLKSETKKCVTEGRRKNALNAFRKLFLFDNI